MPEIEIYTQPWCPFCERAMHILTAKGVAFKEIDAPGGSGGSTCCTGAGAGAVSRSAAGRASRRVSDGAISARVTLVSPQVGQSISPRFACRSNPALSLNHPSNSCSWAHRNW